VMPTYAARIVRYLTHHETVTGHVTVDAANPEEARAKTEALVGSSDWEAVNWETVAEEMDEGEEWLEFTVDDQPVGGDWKP
jgi:hypothetical protein